MKSIFLITTAILALAVSFSPNRAQAEPTICVASIVDGARITATMSGSEVIWPSSREPFEIFERFDGQGFYIARVRCEDLKRFQLYGSVISIALEVGSVATVCTGSIPIAVGIGVAGVALQTLNLVLANLPCEDQEQEKIDRLVCNALARQGAECDPALISH